MGIRRRIGRGRAHALARGHRIEIRGFGSFSINRRPPRMGRNPRSGESVAIPEKRVPHFKPGKALREAVDARTEQLRALRLAKEAEDLANPPEPKVKPKRVTKAKVAVKTAKKG